MQLCSPGSVCRASLVPGLSKCYQDGCRKILSFLYYFTWRTGHILSAVLWARFFLYYKLKDCLVKLNLESDPFIQLTHLLAAQTVKMAFNAHFVFWFLCCHLGFQLEIKLIKGSYCALSPLLFETVFFFTILNLICLFKFKNIKPLSIMMFLSVS